MIRVARSLPPAEDYVDVSADLTEADQVEALAERVRREVGPPDIVVSNAGSFLLRSLEDTSIADFDAQVSVNLRGAFAVARAFVPMLEAAGRGCFITVGSVAETVTL